ncbi:MAG: cyclase family protein [Ruminococcaceae bacterium]|nr:cyclase family protein [Oscillospiraceae bacterium]
MEIIDITRGIFTAEVYPGDPEPTKQNFQSIEKGDSCNLNAFFACCHTGTHVDAPLHFVEDGKSIDQMSVIPFIGPCKVIDVPEGPITGEYVENNFPKGCRRILLKSGGKAYFLDHGAQAAANSGCLLLGTDALSVGTSGNQIAPHKAFLNKEIAILEGLDLTGVDTGSYFLIAQPIKLEGMEAAPARALLIKGEFHTYSK